MEKLSVINLVDLAGSEKAGQTGASGDRLKEGCAINKSLTVLGTCISVLADKAMGKEKKTVVPYRDSALTRILQNALGGNSKTIMICAISPANVNFEESLSTLRYADRAKKIVNKAVINESAQDKLIRELKAENAYLKDMLRKAAMGNGVIDLNALGMNSGEDLIAEMDHHEKAMEEIEKPFEQRLAEQKAVDEVKNKELEEKKKLENPRAPHLVNLNEDPQLSQHIYYSMAEFPVRIGRRKEEPTPQIVFGGISVQPKHGLFNLLDNGLIQLELGSQQAMEQTLINGKRLNSPVQIVQHLDTIYFGQGAMLLFKYPMMKVKLLKFKEDIQTEVTDALEDDIDAPNPDEDEIEAMAWTRLMEKGFGTNEIAQLVCDE